MKTVNYKGFQASVEFEDGALFIRVLHVEDLLVAQCRSVDEIEAALRDLVEDYLAECAELGKEPHKAFSGSFNVRVGQDLHRKAAISAAQCSETLNTWVQTAILEKLECEQLSTRVDNVFGEAVTAIRYAQKYTETWKFHENRARPRTSAVNADDLLWTLSSERSTETIWKN